MDNKWIEIARTGTFTDSAGRPQTFTERDLDAIARAYDPDRRDAPLVFGHPKSDAAPAFGWAQRLKSEGGKLFATFAHVPGEVKELVAKKHYRHVSMSLMPDRVSLRHVALLGAAQPAIDGLAAVELNDGGDAITVDFTTTTEGDDFMTPEELQRQIGQLQAELAALKTENAALKKKADAHKEEKDKADAAKTEAEQKAEKASADFAAYKGHIETERREARVAALVKAGKVKPAERADVLDFAAKLAAVGGAIDFAAQDVRQAAQRSEPKTAFFGDATARPPQDVGAGVISLEERYFRDLEARPVDERFADFSAPPSHGGHASGRQEQGINLAELTAKM